MPHTTIEERKAYHRAYYLAHKPPPKPRTPRPKMSHEEAKRRDHEYYLRNHLHIKNKAKKWREANAFTYRLKHILRTINRRCTIPTAKSYRYYGGRGIQCYLTFEDMKFFWFRDRADLMERPSIDRIDNNGNYVRNNCRFIEVAENTRKGHLERHLNRKT